MYSTSCNNKKTGKYIHIRFSIISRWILLVKIGSNDPRRYLIVWTTKVFVRIFRPVLPEISKNWWKHLQPGKMLWRFVPILFCPVRWEHLAGMASSIALRVWVGNLEALKVWPYQATILSATSSLKREVRMMKMANRVGFSAAYVDMKFLSRSLAHNQSSVPW